MILQNLIIIYIFANIIILLPTLPKTYIIIMDNIYFYHAKIAKKMLYTMEL